MRTRLVLASLAAAAFSLSSALADTLPVPSGTYVMDKTHASLTWKIGHLGLSNYTARMTDFSATITLDADDVANSTVTATIDPLSVRTDYPLADQKDFDAEIASPVIFNAEAHPEITFASTGITVTGQNTADITGDLTFLGMTKPVTLAAILNGTLEKHPFVDGAALGVTATGTIKRSEFGNEFLTNMVLADDVQIIIEAEFIEQK